MDQEQREYRVLEAVGRGGFGTVYKAEVLGAGGFRKRVALKVLNSEVAELPDFARRLRDEARMLGMVEHPAVVRVDGLTRLQGRWTLVMEFVDGVDLKQLVRGGPVPMGPALEVAEQVAAALHAVYDAPGPDGRPLYLLHRDIKPSNVQLTATGAVKVLDFGVARADFDSRESVTRSRFFGSEAYMAPERLDGIDSHAGDVYGLGAVIVELLTGGPVGRTSASRERHEACIGAALARLQEATDDAAVVALTGACLAYDPALRPPARSLARQLRLLRAARASEPWLAEWAEQTVPPLALSREFVVDDLTGSILDERSGVLEERLPDRTGDTLARPASAPAAHDGRTRLLLGLLSALAGTVLVASLGGGVLFLLRDRMGAVTAVPLPAPVEAAAPQARQSGDSENGDAASILAGDDQADVDALAEEPAAPPAPMPARAPPPRTADRPPPPPRAEAPEAEPEIEPPPPPPPASPGGGQVLLASGDARIELVGAAGRFPPGAVPAGRYTVEARFAGAPAVDAGSIQVAEGAVVRLSCRAALKRCIPR